jgi:hypothetical protein
MKIDNMEATLSCLILKQQDPIPQTNALRVLGSPIVLSVERRATYLPFPKDMETVM